MCKKNIVEYDGDSGCRVKPNIIFKANDDLYEITVEFEGRKFSVNVGYGKSFTTSGNAYALHELLSKAAYGIATMQAMVVKDFYHKQLE